MRGIDLKKAFGGQLCQLRNSLSAIIDGKSQATAVDNACLAHRHQLLCRELSIRDSQCGGVVAALKPLAQMAQVCTKAMFPKNIRQIREFFSLGNQYAVKAHCFGVEQKMDGSFTDTQQSVFEILRVITHQSSNCLKLCARLFHNESREEIRFAREVIVQRPFRDASFTGDVGHRRTLVAMRQKDFPCALQNLLALTGLRGDRGGAGQLTWCLGSPLVFHKAPAFFRHHTAMRIMLTEQVGQRKNISVSGV